MSQRNRNKTMSKRSGKMKDDKKPIQKRRKDNKTLSQKSKNRREIFFDRRQ
jgi:hypothetical protein